ncbi:glycoside hydrolase 5 family protein [Mucilaginibacter aquatilis]|uniref:mannan endo-1,4-beta-mannosidase n=1 Tax=Mucilaginibacter aquatilis TaxID=1517760 RepID=A0A6I4ID39_9SPHI|nr:cellulase family glycosylhydrolase [Mucilaginibacter aquatilis]MVN91359.1 cellulase family glycosylhydrolase [Mucilaginibacter aquatilis]
MTKFIKHLLAIFIFSFAVTSAKAQFIQVKEGRFVLNSKPYNYIGANYWYGGLLGGKGDTTKGKQRIRQELDFMKKNGITNLRILAGAEGQGIINGIERVNPALQPEKGVFDENVMKGLDFLLYEMGKRGIYAVIYLSNNWEWSGGFLQYLNWNGQLDISTLRKKPTWDEQRDYTSKFYKCEQCIEDYKKQVNYVITRVNTYTGKPYVNDKTIMAWELANEPRPMRPESIDYYTAWIKGVTEMIKAKDKNHLVTIGTEGSIGTENSDQLYEQIHASKNVDYLTIHIWPKNWKWFADNRIAEGMPYIIANTNKFINRNSPAAIHLKKPLVIEEFGLPRDNHSYEPTATTKYRDKYFQTIFELIAKSKLKGGVLAGCNFWAFGGVARPVKNQLFWKEGDDFMGDPPMEEQGLNTVFDSDQTTWMLIKKYANILSK